MKGKYRKESEREMEDVCETREYFGLPCTTCIYRDKCGRRKEEDSAEENLAVSRMAAIPEAME